MSRVGRGEVDLRATPPSAQPLDIIRLHGRHGDQALHIRHLRVQLRELRVQVRVLPVAVDRAACGRGGGMMVMMVVVGGYLGEGSGGAGCRHCSVNFKEDG